MSRSHELYLHDILKAGKRIESYTKDLSFEAFQADTLRADAVLFNLMTIGEAIKSVPDDLQAKAPAVRWRDIARFRDRVVHHYFKLDLKLVWEVVQEHLPLLLEQVQQLLVDISDKEE